LYQLEGREEAVAMMNDPPKEYGCGNNNDNGKKDGTPCNGYIHVTSIKKGIMKGDFSAEVYSANGLIHGYIYGKFTANIANAE
jgi:hypothetical protein